MDEDSIADLKQFITATMHQEFSGLKDDIQEVKMDTREIKTDLKNLSIRVDDVDAKLDTVIEATGDRLEDHDNRITKLETKTVSF